MNNQECKAKLQVVNFHGDESVFFPCSIKTSKCSGSCNNINHPYTKMYVPDVVKKLFFNWDSLHARLKNHYEAWSYKKKKHKKDYRIQKICLKDVC